MSLTHIGHVVDGSTSTSSFVLTHGLTFTEDDKIIALCHVNATGATVTSTGFTLDDSGDGDTTSNSYHILSKDATASEASTYTFSLSTTTRFSVILVQVRGADVLVTDVFPVVTDGLESGSNSTEGPSINVADNSIAFIWHLEDNTSGVSTYTSTDNSYQDGLEAVVSQAQRYGYRIFSTAATTGETKMSWSGTNTHQGFSFSYKETAGAGGSIIPQAMYHYRNNSGSGL